MHSRFVSNAVVVASALWILTAIDRVGLADWPQWRGPNRDDISTETGLLKSWPEGGPRRVWLFEDCGLGYAGPAVIGNRLYIMGAREGTEQLLAIDVESGEEQWAAPIGELYENDWGGGPRGTPTVDGGLVYALGGQGTLICARADNGQVVWTKAMQDLGGATPNWGYCESPLVYEDKVICTPGGEHGSLAALNKETGEVVWHSTELTSGAHYSSIVVMPHAGHTDLVQLLPDQLVAVNAQTGKLLWTVPWPKPVAAIPTPIVRDQFVYCTSAYGTGCMLVEVGADHAARKAYENKVMKNKHGGVILVGDHLFGHSDGVGWVRQDFKTGEQLWRERDAMEAGAVGYADGMFYCVGEDTGDVALVGPSAEGWKENGRFKLEPQSGQRAERGKIWTHPVICDGRLYLRDQNLVYCYDVRAGADESGGGQ
jgi:outer membrane protein assembly factor BamB